MLGFREDGDYARARDVLRAADFSEAAISRAIGRNDIFRMPSSDVPHVLRKTRGPSRLHTLIRLYFLGLPVPAEEVRSALAPVPLEVWIEGGLLSPPDRHGQVEPRVQIWPVAGQLVAVDLPWRRSAAPPADFVVPPGPLTLQLADAMIRQPCEKILDLGTGSGLLALLAARDAHTVVATDMNERAVSFARFNARLNQIDNIRCVVGDLFEPVAQERFQRIVCNPPFVISPTRRYLFRDSGERGDAFCRRLIRSAVEYLTPGGFLHLTANVPHRTGHAWQSDLQEWFDGLGCDVLVLADRTEAISDYALSWILSTETKDAAEVGRLYEVWMDYYEQERIEAVSYLTITLRRSGREETWIQIDDPPCRIVGPCGEELARFFAWRDAFVAAPEAEAWWDRRVRLAPEIRIVQESSMTADGLEVSHVQVKKTGGLQYPLTVHRNVAHLLAGCDGTRTLGQVLEEMATYLTVGRDQTVAVVLPVVFSLIERGVLLVAPEPGVAGGPVPGGRAGGAAPYFIS